MNECDEESKGEFMENCFDAPGVSRAQIHATVAAAALQFFDEALGVQRSG